MLEALANAMVIVILQYISISNKCALPLKFMQCYMSVISQWRWRGKKECYLNLSSHSFLSASVTYFISFLREDSLNTFAKISFSPDSSLSLSLTHTHTQIHTQNPHFGLLFYTILFHLWHNSFEYKNLSYSTVYILVYYLAK